MHVRMFVFMYLFVYVFGCVRVGGCVVCVNRPALNVCPQTHISITNPRSDMCYFLCSFMTVRAGHEQEDLAAIINVGSSSNWCCALLCAATGIGCCYVCQKCFLVEQGTLAVCCGQSDCSVVGARDFVDHVTATLS